VVIPPEESRLATVSVAVRVPEVFPQV